MKEQQERYFGELVKLPNGTFKAKNIQRLIKINQYKKTWRKCNSRNFARNLNKSKIVIN